jgi:hypothetical protein
MRLILPLILIALMLPYATSDDEPRSEWLIPPDPTMDAIAVNAAATTEPALAHPPSRAQAMAGKMTFTLDQVAELKRRVDAVEGRSR